MPHPNRHAVVSAKKFGGKPEDYVHLHHWMDQPKGWVGSFLSRIFRHHHEGIAEMEKRFGAEFTNSDGRVVQTRLVGEQHVSEDCFGHIPTAEEWLLTIGAHEAPMWMLRTMRLTEDAPGLSARGDR